MAEFPDTDDRVRTIGRERVEALFRRYGFKDVMGHDLLGCVDFQQLLDMAFGTPNDSVRFPANGRKQ